MEGAVAPEETGSHGMKTQALKLVCGISASRYLIVFMHLTERYSHQYIKNMSHKAEVWSN